MKSKWSTSLLGNTDIDTTPAIIQRVKSASVTVDGQLVSSISKGLLVFAAVAKDDSKSEVESMASKILKVKLWDDGEAKWKKNVVDLDYDVLCGSSRTSSYATERMVEGLIHHSLTIHPLSVNQERQQARLPQVRACSKRQGALRLLHRQSPLAVPRRPSQGRSLSGHDGRCVGERWTGRCGLSL